VSEHLHARIAAALGDLYDVESEIGRGGMSIVFRALDRRLRRHVAIKVLPPEFAFDSAVRERFRREAQTAAQLNHPNIVPIHSVDEKDGIAFFAMTLCDGDSLAARLARVARPPLDEVRRVLCEVADALAYAHARGVVHRDIKPDNILLDRDTGRVMVTDFGIARAAEAGSRLTVTGIAVGTPAYMSPEQALGEHEIDGRSDIYSLGVVGYQMLAGVTPFTANNTPSMLMKHVSELPMPLTTRRHDVPVDLAMAIERALRKRPDDRWQTALELRDVLAGHHPPGYAGRSDLAMGHAPTPPRQSPPVMAGAPLSAKESKRARRQRKHVLRHRPEAALSLDERIRKLRHKLVTYSGTSTMLLGINYFTAWTGGPSEPWFLIPTAVLAADILRRFGGLWADGISMTEVLRRPQPPRQLAGEASLAPMPAGPGQAPYASRSMEPVRAGPGTSHPLPALGHSHQSTQQRSPAGPPAPPARAPSPREVREQMRAAAQLRNEVEEDRRIWGRATSLRQRFVQFRQQVLVTASFATLSVGLGLMVPFEPAMVQGLVLSLIPVGLFGRGILRQARSLERDNVEPTDVLIQPLDVLVRQYDPASLMARYPDTASGRPELQSPYMEAVRRATADRAEILEAVRRMSKVDRRLLPDVVPTVNALVERIASLAPTLHRLDADLRPNSLEALETRIAEAASQPSVSPESERKLTLLQRQRTSLQDLLRRRDVLLGQLESASLLLQNLKLDLIKVRSAGVHASVQGVNNATQEARALSVEIGYVLGAAEEIRGL
jgi:serine/threonine-protein kinase